MEFPDWAPAEGVTMYHKWSFERTVHTVTLIWPDRNQQIDDLVVLERLLSKPMMRAVWSAIGARPQPEWHRTRFIDNIFWMLRDHQDSDKRSAGVRKKALLRLSKLAQDLIEGINADEVAMLTAFDTVRDSLVSENRLMRIENNDYVPLEDWFPEFPNKHCFGSHPTKKWAEWSAEQQLKYWAETTQELHLCDLLGVFVEQIEKAAEPPKHPVKDGGQGLKAFLIRRLGAYMKSTYGSHLPDLVGATVASIFDFDEPLTRDDVRPYLKPTGKKSRVIE